MARIRMQLLAITLLALVDTVAQAAEYDAAKDWPFLTAYRGANAALGAPAQGESRVVFMGDSITEFWKSLPEHAPAGDRYVNRGISGQTTPQMSAPLSRRRHRSAAAGGRDPRPAPTTSPATPARPAWK